MEPSTSLRRPFLPSCPQCRTSIRTLRELHSQAARCPTCANRWQRAVEVRREQRHLMETLLSAQRAALVPSEGLMPVTPTGSEIEMSDAGASGNLLLDASVPPLRPRDPSTAIARFQQCMPPPLMPTIHPLVNISATLARSMRTYRQPMASTSTQTTPRAERGSYRSDNLVDLTLPEETSTASQTTQNQTTFRIPMVPKRDDTRNSVAEVVTVQLPTSDESSNNPGRRQLMTVEEEPPNEDIANNQSVVAPTERIQSSEQASANYRATTIVSLVPPIALAIAAARLAGAAAATLEQRHRMNRAVPIHELLDGIQGRDMTPTPRDNTTAQPQSASNSSSQSTQDTEAEANRGGQPTTEPKKYDDKQT